MKTNKFKGIRVDNNEWIEGYLYGNCIIIGLNSKYTLTSIGTLITEMHEVIPESVVQYIGKRDKNHTEIYEGDNFKFFPKLIRTIIFVDAQFRPTDILDTGWWKNGEIVGNIHDKLKL